MDSITPSVTSSESEDIVQTSEEGNIYDFKEWTYVDEANPNLICSVCTFPFILPMTLNCGHTFCKDCIEESLKHQPRCPTCREPCKMPPEKACVAIRCLVDELMVQCPFPRCEKQGQRQWMSQKHIHVCLCKPSTPFLIRRCTCVSQTNKLESLEKLVLQLQQSQVEFSERLDTLSSSISTHVYPKLSSLESDLSTIRCTLEADSNFKMDTAQKCSSIQAELLALRRRSDAFLESTTRGFKMLGLRPARVEKL